MKKASLVRWVLAAPVINYSFSQKSHINNNPKVTDVALGKIDAHFPQMAEASSSSLRVLHIYIIGFLSSRKASMITTKQKGV